MGCLTDASLYQVGLRPHTVAPTKRLPGAPTGVA
ncbi:hypothetical protein [Sporisorium scitamineum]|uniref:Uncharacterized protein n=1 Tax=Sporisorium scitamineum TaxID=49012 RepID=A0A0F7S7F3_9BASI|nr:hypothetical protein [Sporisorium scitamineum]